MPFIEITGWHVRYTSKWDGKVRRHELQDRVWRENCQSQTFGLARDIWETRICTGKPHIMRFVRTGVQKHA